MKKGKKAKIILNEPTWAGRKSKYRKSDNKDVACQISQLTFPFQEPLPDDSAHGRLKTNGQSQNEVR